MEPSYRITLRIGPFFFAKWIPRVAHLKGWFIGKKRKKSQDDYRLF